MTSPSASQLEKLRPVGCLERYSTARNHLGFYTNVAVTATYTLPATCSLPLRAYIYKVCETLIGQHPILSAIPVDEDTRAPYFARLPAIDLDRCVSFEEWKAPADSEPARDAELDELLTAQHRSPFAGLTLPFWRLCVRTDPGNPTQFTAAFVFHHAIGDGGSGMAFHRTFLDALGGAISSSLTSSDVKSVIPAPQTPLLPNVEELHPMPLSIFFLLSVIFREKLWRRARDPALWTGGKIATPLETQVRHVVVSKRDTTAFKDLCRKNQTTVTAALQVLIASALFRNLPAQFSKLHCNGAISSRRWLRGDAVTDDSIGVWVQDFDEVYQRSRVCRPDSDGVQFSWAEAQRSKRTLDRILSSQGKNAKMYLLKYVNDYQNDFFRPKLGKDRDGSFEVSNVGVFRPTAAPSKEEAGRDGQDGPRIGRVVFSQSANVVGAALETSVVTGCDGCLVLAFSWQKGVVEEDLVAAVIDTVRTELAAFGEKE
ncbi:hypothetical protein VTO42DRAFT_7924 [Malbranchea cinnamomea]